MWNYMCIRRLINWSDSTKMHGATIRFIDTFSFIYFEVDMWTVNYYRLCWNDVVSNTYELGPEQRCDGVTFCNPERFYCQGAIYLQSSLKSPDSQHAYGESSRCTDSIRPFTDRVIADSRQRNTRDSKYQCSVLLCVSCSHR